MNKLIIIFLVCICFLPDEASGANPSKEGKNPRFEKIINSHWTFNYFPGDEQAKGCEVPGFNDSGWPVVSIPHTWNTYETTGEEDPFIKNRDEREYPYWWTGWGWYRKGFRVDADLNNSKIFVEFEGVHKYCRVWINGKYLGDHKGGYGSFGFDVTEHLSSDSDNILAVAVSNIQNDSFGIPPMSAPGINNYGGITGNVTILINDKLYIPMQGSALHDGGTFVTSPQVSEKSARIRVQTWVKNEYPEPKNCILYTRVTDASGNTVRSAKAKRTIQAGETYIFDQTLKPLKNPRLWSPDDPYLYEVNSEVTTGGSVTDAHSSPLGLRWFRWDYNDNALYVNGKKTILSGTVFRQEYPWLGIAVPEWIIEEGFRDMKENLKYNFIRTLNYPSISLICSLADRYGMIVSAETPLTGSDPFSKEVSNQMVSEMIRKNRNHPSVMFWGLGSETDKPADQRVAQAEDTTRILSAFRISGSAEARMLQHSFEKASSAYNIHGSYLPLAQISSGTELMNGEDPVRLLVKASGERIPAAKNSVVIVSADFADSKGNLLTRPDLTVRWSVEGSGTLAGSTVYPPASGMGTAAEPGIPWTKAFNVVRSSGAAGRITVTASASGLASGSVVIDAVRSEDPGTSLITEPVPDETGRNPVVRPYFYVSRLDDVPREIEMTDKTITIRADDERGYASLIRDHISVNNPDLDTTTIEFLTLTNLFASHLNGNEGRLSANDYNFSVDQFNNCRLISTYIEATKLPPLFKLTLRGYYSEEMITRGREKNAGDEMNWLNWIPSGGTVIVSQTGKMSSWPKGTVITGKTDLNDLIAAVYPVFARYGPDARERALTFISKMNPYIEVNETEEGERKIITYTAQKGKPILIPLIKFIAE